VDEIRVTILQGVAPRMPAFNGRLSQEEVKAVAIYTRRLMGKETPHPH
jgi:mono/diheme cytochrome c family protein